MGDHPRPMKSPLRSNSLETLEARIAPSTLAFVNPTTATYTDPNGDLVTVKFTKPILSAANVGHVLVTAAIDATHDQLQQIDLTVLDIATSPKGTGITVTARPSAAAGDGLAHLGYINATGFDLATVNIHGDLGAIDAGDATPTTMGIAKLTVQSLGAFGTTTGAPDLKSDIQASLGSLAVLTDVKNAKLALVGTAAKLGSLTIGGSLIGDGGAANAGAILVGGNIGTVKIGGDVVGGAGAGSGLVQAGGTIGNVTIGGSLLGGAAGDTGEILALGASMGAVKIGVDVIGGTGMASFSGAINSHGKLAAVTIGGSLVGGSNSDSGLVVSTGDMALVKVGGNVKGGSGFSSGFINSHAKLAGVKVTGSVIGGTGIDSGQIESDGDMGAITIGLDLRGADASGVMSLFCSGFITSAHKIASVTIGGSIISGVNTSNNPLFDDGAIRAGDDLGKVVVKGSLIGNATNPVLLTGRGKLHPAGTDVAIASVTVSGRAEYANILGGYNNSFAATPANGDAQIGAVKIGGDWIASNLVAGAKNLGVGDAAGGSGSAADNVNFGDAHDFPIAPGVASVASKIASIAIGGVIRGTVSANDHFGFVAEQIGSFTVAGVAIPLSSGAHNDNRNIGLTGDVTIHETSF
jgi:hypothetical protein